MAEQGPPFETYLRELKPPEVPPGTGKALRVFLVLGVLLFLARSAFYQVEPEEVGVVLRFGKYHSTSSPGLHFMVPIVDRVYKVAVQRQLNEEFGFSTQRGSGDPAGEANMLTGDLNAAVVEWVVQYRVTDPLAFLFEVRNISETFRDMSEAVMREVVGDRTVAEVLTVGRQEVASTVVERLQELCDEYKTGITVDQVVLQDVTPPDPVRPAFNEVNEAQQERETKINQAQAEYNKVIPRARGEAAQTVQAAEGYALDRVNRAKGEAARFESLFREYQKAPEITRRRIYLETMSSVLPNISNKVIVDEDLRGLVPLLGLDNPARSQPRNTAGGGGQ